MKTVRTKWAFLCACLTTIILDAPTIWAAGERYVFSQDFALGESGWIRMDVNTDGQTWQWRDFGGARGGECYRYLSHATNSANDWLFTPAIPLSAGQQYTLSFDHRVTAASMSHGLSVMMGTTRNPSAMITQIASLTAITNEQIRTTTAPLTVSASGNYYLGFRCTSAANRLALYLDNVILALPETALQIRFQLDKIFYQSSNVYTSTEPIRCLVFVKNIGTTPVMVNGLLAIAHESDPLSVLSFLATDPKGQSVPFKIRAFLPSPRPEHFKLLQPGESVWKYYDLNSGPLSFKTLGRYRVSAVYKNLATSSVTPAPWRGKLVTSPVELFIR